MKSSVPQRSRSTNDLLHDAKAANEKREVEIQEKGELWVGLRSTLEQIGGLSSTLNNTWLKMYDTRRQKETGVALLVQRHGAELRQLEAQFTDGQKSLNNRMQSILEEFRELFSDKKR